MKAIERIAVIIPANREIPFRLSACFDVDTGVLFNAI